MKPNYFVYNKNKERKKFHTTRIKIEFKFNPLLNNSVTEVK